MLTDEIKLAIRQELEQRAASSYNDADDAARVLEQLTTNYSDDIVEFAICTFAHSRKQWHEIARITLGVDLDKPLDSEA